MFQKNINLMISLVILFLCINLESVKSYEFIDKKNEKKVKDLINEVYNMKQQYEDLVGVYEETEVTIYDATSTTYWWPIGSKETTEVDGKIFATGDPETVNITSEFGYRIHPITGKLSSHKGVDIAGGSGEGNVNVIAARDGIVVYPSNLGTDNCKSSRSLDGCGGGYGNYLIIQHGDGNYTLYAHLYQGTVTVKSGDSVKQGQVIAKMGSSGNSTGPHLHFEIREGANSSSATVNPLEYISEENPRSVSTGGEFLSWLNSWEGRGKIEGNYYIVEDLDDGVLTVGSGVTLENNIDSFAKHGINIADYPAGSKIPISIVDAIEMEEVSAKRSIIEKSLSENSITLAENEIQALVSRMYNCGNNVGFVSAYKAYGNTQELYDNWFFDNLKKGSKFEAGLTRRRNAEWALFHTGEYVYN